MTKFYYVYLLVDVATGKHRYTGVTADLKASLAKHNTGKVPHTSKFKPWKIETVMHFHPKRKPMLLKHILKHTVADHSPNATSETSDPPRLR